MPRPKITEMPAWPGSTVPRRCPGPASRSPDAVPSTTTSSTPMAGMVTIATGSPTGTTGPSGRGGLGELDAELAVEQRSGPGRARGRSARAAARPPHSVTSATMPAAVLRIAAAPSAAAASGAPWRSRKDASADGPRTPSRPGGGRGGPAGDRLEALSPARLPAAGAASARGSVIVMPAPRRAHEEPRGAARPAGRAGPASEQQREHPARGTGVGARGRGRGRRRRPGPAASTVGRLGRSGRRWARRRRPAGRRRPGASGSGVPGPRSGSVGGGRCVGRVLGSSGSSGSVASGVCASTASATTPRRLAGAWRSDPVPVIGR